MTIATAIDTKECSYVPTSDSKYAWWAARDASMKSAMNASRFTEETKVRADRVKQALQLVYSYSDITITNTKTWIRVKVHDAYIKDRKNLRELEAQWAAQNITKVLTKQGIIYRIRNNVSH